MIKELSQLRSCEPLGRLIIKNVDYSELRATKDPKPKGKAFPLPSLIKAVTTSHLLFHVFDVYCLRLSYRYNFISDYVLSI